MKQLQGKTALITGASRGIGHAIARKFAAAGADLVLTHLSSDEQGEELAKEFRAFGGFPLLPIPGYRSLPSGWMSVSGCLQFLNRRHFETPPPYPWSPDHPH